MLIHNSRRQLTKVRVTKQVGLLDADHDKPLGLWVSVNEAWKEWCLGEEYKLGRFAYRTEVVLAQNHRVLILEDEEATVKFLYEYATHNLEFNGRILVKNQADWTEFSKEYDGIIFEYWDEELAWKLREFRLYINLCCASGCIWNPKAVESLRSL